MPNNSDKKVIMGIIGAAVVVFLLVYLGITIPGIIGGEDQGLTKNAVEELGSIIEDIDVKKVPHSKGLVEIQPPDLIESLPDISKSYPPQVEKSTPSYIEIFSSTEKAGSALMAG
jgi:Ca-activated chloride channel family protein